MDKDTEALRIFHKGEVIVREGQTNTTAWMVKAGTVVVYRVVDNRRVVLARLGPGNIFGEMSLVTGQPSTASAMADEYTELIPFDRTLLQSMLLKCPVPMQRMMVLLMEQLQTMHAMVQPQATADLFLALTSILDLAARAAQPSGRRDPDGSASVSHQEFCRLAKDILLVSQLELDVVLETLVRFAMIRVREPGTPGFAAGERQIEIKDQATFLARARRMREAVREAPIPPHTEGLEFLDVLDLAEKAGVTPEELRAKIAQGELPESLLFFARERAEQWLQESEVPEPVKRPRRGEGEIIIDDVVRFADNKVHDVLAQMEPGRVALLYAAADQPARAKLMANMSAMMGEKVRDLAKGLKVDIDELTRVEVDFFRLMRRGERL